MNLSLWLARRGMVGFWPEGRPALKPPGSVYEALEGLTQPPNRPKIFVDGAWRVHLRAGIFCLLSGLPAQTRRVWPMPWVVFMPVPANKAKSARVFSSPFRTGSSSMMR